jgi:hypothetical protein
MYTPRILELELGNCQVNFGVPKPIVGVVHENEGPNIMHTFVCF